MEWKCDGIKEGKNNNDQAESEHEETVGNLRRERRYLRSDCVEALGLLRKEEGEEEMTKIGYHQVLVSAAVYNRLKTIATENGLSLGKTISKLLEHQQGIDTRIDTPVSKPSNQNPTQIPIQQTDAKRTSFSEREGLGTVGSQWRARRDLNPRPLTPEASVISWLSRHFHVYDLLRPTIAA